MKLKPRINNIDTDKIKYVSEKYNLPSAISTLLLARTNIDDIDSYIFPDIKSLFSPFLIKNMQKVIEKIKFAKDNDKKILIYGDYDVDGITATSLLYMFFNEIGVKSDYYIPPRANGYGLTVKSIDEAISKYCPDIMITVDCGITSVDEVKYVKDKGVDIIVTDHHNPQSVLPDTIIINPHIEDLKFKDLCGCGVAFKIIEGYYNRQKEFYIKYLPIVAIATVADVVPLICDNRIMVQLGFSLQSMLPKGIQMLLDMLEVGKNELNSQVISFKLAPVLNSAGRLKNSDLAVRIFVSNDEDELVKLCSELIITNKDRQKITEEIFLEAEKEISKEEIPPIVVLKSKDWDAGIIGIVASKIMDKYKRSTILFTENNGVLKGSCRSIDGINIFDELTKVGSLIVQFGGHEKAAGLTIETDKFDEFKRQITENVRVSMKNIETVTYYDLAITSEEINVEFAKKLSILEPFGECNPLPIFLLEMNKPEIEFLKNPKHISLRFHSIKVKYFYADKQILNYSFFNNSYNLVKISLSTFNGISFVNISCDNAMFNDLSNNSQKEQEKRYKYFNSINLSSYNKCDIESIKEKNNYIICVYDYDNYKKLEKIFGNTVTYTAGSVMMAGKRKNICYCLENLSETKNFDNVYFTEESIARLADVTEKNLIEGFEDKNYPSLTREKLLTAYLALDRYIKFRPIQRDNLFIIEDFDGDEMYFYFKNAYSNFNLTESEFLYALVVFIELEIIEIKDNNLYMDKEKKCDLKQSRLLK